MNFSAISSIQNQTQELSKQREQRSFNRCKKGFELLVEAENTNFQDKSLLMQACDAFASAIAQQRLAPDPYLGMGYILFLLKDYPASITYLTEVLQLEPEHPDARFLLAKIKDITSPRPSASQSSYRALASKTEAFEEPIDYDQLYDDVEARVHEEMRKLTSGRVVPSTPSVHKAELSELKGFVARQQAILSQLLEQLKIVDEEIDTDELRAKLKTIEKMTWRYENVLEISRDMLKIKKEIKAMKTGLEELKKQIKTAQNRDALGQVENTLENVLDRCDQIADNLDELEEENTSVLELVDLYESLVLEVDKLNDLFDDAMASL